MRYLGSKWTVDDFVGLRTLVVPSGIGEFQWVMTKLVNQDEPLGIIALDGAPRRLHQFVELHPNVHAFGYIGLDYTQICGFQEFHELYTWRAVTRKFSLGQPAMIACNPHLEAGRPLAQWFPDLDTTYRYELVTAPEHSRQAARFSSTDPVIGISCASYRGAAAWRTWEKEEWVDLLTRLHGRYPNLRFAFMGGSWDDLTSEVFDELSGSVPLLTDAVGIPPVGQTKFGAAVEMLETFVGFIGFSSGIGHVAAHCCGTPVFMLWPDFQELLSRSWVDPALLQSGRYVPATWDTVDNIFPRVQAWMESHVCTR